MIITSAATIFALLLLTNQPALAQVAKSTERHTGRLTISCTSQLDNPKIMLLPDFKSVLKRNIGFSSSYSFNIREFIETDNGQILAGYLVTGNGRLVTSGDEQLHKDRDILFVDSREWDCSLYHDK